MGDWGLVADGVTPLLVEIAADAKDLQPFPDGHPFRASGTLTGGGKLNWAEVGDAFPADTVRVLDPTRGSWSNNPEFRLTAERPTAFVWIAAIAADDVQLSIGLVNNGYELGATPVYKLLGLSQAGGGTAVIPRGSDGIVDFDSAAANVPPAALGANMIGPPRLCSPVMTLPRSYRNPRAFNCWPASRVLHYTVSGLLTSWNLSDPSPGLCGHPLPASDARGRARRLGLCQFAGRGDVGSGLAASGTGPRSSRSPHQSTSG